jgi:hypothetical protein
MSGRETIAAVRARWHWLIPAGVIFGLVTPILFTDRSFATDWGNHLWVIWAQGLNIRELGEPSYFLQSNFGLFYPNFAFYGGSFYAVAGLIAQIFSPEAAVLCAYTAALAACYLGWTWIARQLGVAGWRAQLPGCIAVTAPLAVTNLYGRGDIPEAVATSFIPLIAASGLSMLRERRVRVSTAAVYVGGIVVLTGTHTLTLAWGSVFLLACAALLAVCYWRVVREHFSRIAALGGLTALGAAINAWILVPLVLYHTRLVEREPDLINLTAYTDPARLFSLLRDSGDPYPIVTADIEAQLPVLALLWALFCGVAYWRFFSAANRRLAIGLLGLGGGLLLLVLSPSLIEELPNLLRFIQFPYRVLTYVNLCIVGLVTLTLAAVQRDPSTARLPVFALAAIAIFNFGLSIDQSFAVRSWLPNRDEALLSSVQTPSTWYAPLQFADGSEPIVKPTLEPLRFPVEDRLDSYAVAYPPGPAGTVGTNIATGPYLVDVTGARPVGRTPEGMVVLRLPASRQSRLVEVQAAWSPVVTAGRWLTIVTLLVALVGAGAYLIVGRRRAG